MTTRQQTVVGFTGHQMVSILTLELVRPELTIRLAEHLPVIGVTSLAAGSDQVFADCVLILGGELSVVIPSRQYEKSFKSAETLSNYRRLLELASNTTVLEHDAPGENAYWDAGQKVVEQADVVVAVWDGQPAAGLGGTADVVRYAHQIGRPVIVVWPEGASRETT